METREHGPNERIDQNSRIKAKQNGDKQSIRFRVQNTGYKDAKAFSEDLSIITKTQSEMKNPLIEMKNNLQGNNSRLNEAENQINDLKYKEAKNNHAEHQEEKRVQKN